MLDDGSDSFDAVWDAMTPNNRVRLMRAVVRRVEVNEPDGQVRVILNDLGTAEAGAESAAAAEASA